MSKVGSKTGIQSSVLAFLKCMDGSILAFLKCMDRSVFVSLKCINGSVLAHLGFSIQSAPTKFAQSGNSSVPSNIRHKDFRPSSVLHPSYSITLVLPLLKSETGWTGELLSNRVLLILKTNKIAFFLAKKNICKIYIFIKIF